MEKIIALCKSRGFIYPSSSIYGGLANTWDYGPLGVELKNNIKKTWWQKFIKESSHNVVLDSAILMNPSVFYASGHLSSFSDPLMDCRECKERFRADSVINDFINLKNDDVSEQMLKNLCDIQNKNKPNSVEYRSLLIKYKELSLDFGQFDNKTMEEFISEHKISCPNCNKSNFTNIRQFNLMFKTFTGVTEDSKNTVYLRPETAQGIFINFKNVQRSSRKKIPFGIGQIGKSFRNEITPGNFIFRTREFEQMELEFFCKPCTDTQWFIYFKNFCIDWLKEFGLKEHNLKIREHTKEELSHYSRGTVDIEYNFPFGFGELLGIANRGDFDLKNHSEHSNEDLTYFDQESNERYIPFVIEPSLGVDRSLLAFLCDAFEQEQTPEGDMRTVLKLNPHLAPFKAAVLPLSKKLSKLASKLAETISKKFNCDFDDIGSIGNRYRRQDEIGTPFCITYDFDSLEDNMITVRDRDNMKQIRMPISEVISYLDKHILF